MSERKTLTDAVMLRMHLKANMRLRVEVLAAISTALRHHGLEASDELLQDVTFAVSKEVEAPLRGPNLPGGTNC